MHEDWRNYNVCVYVGARMDTIENHGCTGAALSISTGLYFGHGERGTGNGVMLGE